jgi:hypothetical protein
VLAYIDLETRTMDDLSSFKCIVRSQKIIPIPDEISINVPENDLPESSSLQNRYVSVSK